MFESATLPHVMDKETYRHEEPKLREALLGAQLELAEKRTFPVVIVIAGVDGAGKGKAIQKLYEWLDPHHIHTHAYGDLSDDERARPRMWRYWRDLPPRGETGVVFGSWYNGPLRARILDEIDDGDFEGALILKFWFHLARDEQKKRLKKIAKGQGSSRDVLEEWSDINRHKAAVGIGEKTARVTSTGYAPWTLVEAEDKRLARLKVLETICERLEAAR